MNLFDPLFNPNLGFFKILTSFLKRYPSPIRLWTSNGFFVYMNSPEDIQIVLNSPNSMEKNFFYKFFQLPYGLFSGTGLMIYMIKTKRNHKNLLKFQLMSGSLTESYWIPLSRSKYFRASFHCSVRNLCYYATLFEIT